ncbi:MAG: UDP-glucose/GDP-mannose dehydrogenase family protein [Chloroflexi bacterium]|nr:UDP-glucose/GDP-mannose dehydrogenase family protein [Chloroflexota bacterium]
MKISVIGAGYVGLVTGACFGKFGHEVVLVDSDPGRVEAINGKNCPIYEEGLDQLLVAASLRAGVDARAAAGSEVIFICVGTPFNHAGAESLEQVATAARQVGQILKDRQDYCVVAVKSTVPPGATEGLVIPLLEEAGKKAGDDFGVCMCPEFLREGKAVYDFLNPVRIIIGEYDRRSGDLLASLYQGFTAPVLRTGLRTAEMIKLASNAFLATRLSFINEIGNICKRLGIDVYEVAKGMGLDDRIGSRYLNAGLGFGGSCLPKDVRMLVSRARESGYQPGMLDNVLKVNEGQPLAVIELLEKHIALRGAVIGLLGLSFKPGTDDIRDSSAIRVAQALMDAGAKVRAYDPAAVKNFRKLFPQIEYPPVAAVMASDAIVIATEWEEFNKLDYRGKIVVDGRRVPAAKEARIYEGLCW